MFRFCIFEDWMRRQNSQPTTMEVARSHHLFPRHGIAPPTNRLRLFDVGSYPTQDLQDSWTPQKMVTSQTIKSDCTNQTTCASVYLIGT
ncbi:hypothetical protein Fuma_03464 [Fuerstiella marisgermanici]|uniref:Uncharacterized protein n=1 Tax=Fuerstiella marisgermanici TaxID=1891926 RepID=A0A1P8WIG3_9PLAN|nr:hypothetical protein Fuma_03464 [Fuerstiella marisgermanici]